MRLARSIIPLLCAVAAASCGPTDENGDGIADGIQSPDSVTAVAPSTPIGSVSGIVLDTRFRPIEGADIKMNVGGPTGIGEAALEAKSDAQGFYFAKNIPAGAQVLLTIGKPGFATARAAVTVPAAAGNFPINNGNGNVVPVLLTDLSGTVKFLVVTRSGRPARQVRAQLEAFPAYTEMIGQDPYGVSRGSIVADATADDSGMLTFTGIPSPEEVSRLSGMYILHVSSHDENGDGVIDSGGFVQTYDNSSMLVQGTVRTITLPDARTDGAGFRVLATNVPSLTAGAGVSQPVDNMLRTTDAIYIVFNEALEPSSIDARLADETGTKIIPSTATIGATGTTLTIQPTQGLSVGIKYNLSVRATSLDTGGQLSLDGYLFGGEIASPKAFAIASIAYRETTTGTNILDSGEEVYFNFNQPIASFGGGRVYVYFNFDVSGNGQNSANDPGEFGAASSPYEIFPIEPAPAPLVPVPQTSPQQLIPAPLVVNLKASGYTSVFTNRNPVTGVAWTFPGTVTVPAGTSLRVAFTKNASVGSGFQTIWSKTITEDVTSALTVLQSP